MSKSRYSIFVVFLCLASGGEAHGGGSDWGTIDEAAENSLLANAWVARVRGLGQISDFRVLESRHPGTSDAPSQAVDSGSFVPFGGSGIGGAKGGFSRSLGNEVPDVGAGGTKSAPGAVYAEAGAADMKAGLGFIEVHLEQCVSTALSEPGNPVLFSGGCGKAYVTLGGQTVLEIPKQWPANFQSQIPTDKSQPPFALITTNEQVSTDTNGKPTLDPTTGEYQFDSKASSGYINTMRISFLGKDVADITLGHAAVIRSPKDEGH